MGKITWSEKQRKQLIKLFSTTSTTKLVELLGKSDSSIRHMASKLSLKKTKEFKDTNKSKRRKLNEVQIVSDYVSQKYESYNDLCRKHKISKSTLFRILKEAKVSLPKVPASRAWSASDLKYLKDNLGKITLSQIAKNLDRSKTAVAKQASKQELTKKKSETSIEKIVESLLIELKVPYTKQARINTSGRHYYRPDFLVRNIVVEAFGDFYHCNPKKFNQPSCKTQQENLARDKTKLEWYKNNGYEVVIIWESDLDDLDKVRNDLKLVLLK